MNEFTPMMAKYLETKENYQDCILFYRLGDFYEMFFHDAEVVSKELELTLTGKSCGQEERAPMCGIPYHAADTYISKLINRGYKVAICDQVEDPKLAKGLVKREVTRIVTPGTNTNVQELDETKNNYLMCVFYLNEQFGIAAADVTTGDFYATQADDLRYLWDEINHFSPSEIIGNSALHMSGLSADELALRFHCLFNPLNDRYFDETKCIDILKEHFKFKDISQVEMQKMPFAQIAAGAMLGYLYETQKISMEHFTSLKTYEKSKYMMLDSATRRNLELTETLREKQKRGSLLWVLDKTKTAMGARQLRSFIEQPLIDTAEITKRLDAIEELKNKVVIREEMREYLNSVYDLERLMGKISYHTANPRDLIAFLSSITMFSPIACLLNDLETPLLSEIRRNFDTLSDIAEEIDAAIAKEPPLSMKEGGIINSGYNEEVDRLRVAKTEGKNWLASLEVKEREQTGIKNLRIRFNRVFGYYFEVTNSYKNLVPEYWIRKQTLANAERYTTPELKTLESDILGAEDKLFSLEYDLFAGVREDIAKEVKRIQTTAKMIALLDTIASFAAVAEKNNFVRPKLNTEGKIVIKEGRHPVVEKMLSHDLFVANDTFLDNKDNRVAIITGPNMAGKSTYMRQTALIVLMAQIGSFVPADEADIGIVDRIFTRVGASDDLASGQSTFMVEMNEVANILRNATRNSLLILDEIGRGTSTYDGLSIAWAVTEHVADTKLIGAKTLFATHYHELTELEGRLPGIKNYCIAVKEQGETIQFLRKIIRGGADKSYGIQVARLAGLPESVLKRATQISEKLNESDIIHEKTDFVPLHAVKRQAGAKSRIEEETQNGRQLSLFETVEDSVIRKLKSADITSMKPIDALNLLNTLQEQLHG